MSGPRAFILILGIVFFLLGLWIASSVESLLGLGFAVVGVFLVILPFTAIHGDA